MDPNDTLGIFQFAGLFNRAISQSGSPLSFWAVHNKTVNLREHAVNIMELFGCNQPTIPLKVECLRKTSWKELINYNRRKVSISHTNVE